MLKYICISDLHCGAPTSLLMPPPVTFSGQLEPVTSAFALACESLLSAARASPQLILLGDVLDLQFSNRSHAVANAIGFLKHLQQTGQLGDEVIATAGNHDHALWSDARLAIEADTFSTSSKPFTYQSATHAFKKTAPAKSRLLTHLLKSANFKSVDLRYPNIGLRKDDRVVMLHHGHFCEDAYRLISTLRDQFTGRHRHTLSASDISAENAGWIDFFWSTFGDAGFGLEASDFYQNMLTTVGFRRISAKLADQIGERLSDQLPMSGNLTVQQILRTATQVALDSSLGRFRDTERYAEVISMTHDGYESLTDYLAGPVKGQIIEEQGKDLTDVTFVFGHTHKPFEERIVAPNFDQPVKVYNTGGWTLNGPRLDNAEGAAMILIDDKLNVASLRLFGTPHDGKVKPAHVRMLGPDTKSAKSFHKEINQWLIEGATQWQALADAAKDGYVKRQKYLLDLTAGNFKGAAQ